MLGSSSAAGGSSGSELERLRRLVAKYFTVYEARVGPQSLLLAVHADRADLEGKFDRLRRELWDQGYVPILRRERGEEFVEVVRRPKLGVRRVWINLALLAGTIATTVFAGAMIWLAYVGRLDLGLSDFAWGALYFAGPLLAILGVHETAHYVVARRRHLDASLPYFIPIPPPYILGTFGAFVSIREPFPDRKALFDVGAAGPLAGFAMSLPIVFGGLFLSAHAPVLPLNYCGPSLLGQSYGNLLLGDSLLWQGFLLFFPAGFANVHPLAFAGWVGILVTAINLLPAGSLDGGHIFRALLGEKARYVSYAAALGLFGLGLFYPGWLFFAIIVLLLGLRHPPPLNDLTPLDAKRYAAGAVVAAILVGGFVLVPLATPQGAVSVVAPSPTPWTSHLPPNQTVGANFSLNVTNGDPIARGFVVNASIVGVTVKGSSNNSTPLRGGALANWESNASWTFLLPNNTTVGPRLGASAQLSSTEYFPVDGGATVAVLVSLTNYETAVAVHVVLRVTELCAPSGSGTASVDEQAIF